MDDKHGTDGKADAPADGTAPAKKPWSKPSMNRPGNPGDYNR